MVPLPRFLKKALLGIAMIFIGGFLAVSWLESRLSISPDHDYLAEIERLADEGSYGEALAIAETVVAEGGMPNEDRIRELIPEIQEEKESKIRKMKDAAKGFVTGNANTGSELAGSLAGDFIFWGDIRDLTKEGYHWVTGEEVDEFVAALSALGLIASGATFFPEPSTTAGGVSAQTGLTTFKFLRKTDALTEPLMRQIRRSADACKEIKSIEPLGDHLGALWILVRHAPDGATPTIMRNVESTHELSKVADWTKADANRTFTLVHVGGRTAVQTISSGGNVRSSWVRVTIRKGASEFAKIRWFSRLAKFFETGGLGEVRRVIVDSVIGSPWLRPLLALISLTLLGFGGYLLFPKVWGKRLYRTLFPRGGPAPA